MSEMIKDFDNWLLEQFARHGYSMEDIKKLGEEGRLYKFDQLMNPNNTVYCVDGEALFRVEDVIGINTNVGDNKYRYSVTMRCVDLKEAKTKNEKH